MQLAAFAFDYDGTLACNGRVADATLDGLRRLKAAGQRLLLLSGRELPDLQAAFPAYDIFDAIIAENGGLMLRPALHEERVLGSPPPPALLASLQQRHIEPLSVGRSIIATRQPHETAMLEAIRECGVEWQIVFNKGAVMCLPAGVNKASGLRAALDVLELSPLNVCATGDAENDHAMLAACGFRAAVANAIDALKAEADFVSRAQDGAGVIELIEVFLGDERGGLTGRVRRHDLRLGQSLEGETVAVPPSATVLVVGASGAGKSRLATLLVERILEHGFQLCLVDPEGEYDRLPQLSALGDPQTPPSLEEAARLLRRPRNNVALNLLGVALEDRPRCLARITKLVEELRVRSARPHWLLVDEAHHAMPPEAEALRAQRVLPGTVLVSAAPSRLAPAVLSAAQIVIAVGSEAPSMLDEYCRAAGLPVPPRSERRLQRDEVLCWHRALGRVHTLRVDAPRLEHQRHIRKYAHGSLGVDKSFHFRGPHGTLNLRAQNLTLFLQMAAGVDDDTWLFHLRRGDYGRWFRESIRDAELAEEAAGIERRLGGDAVASRAAMRELVSRRYTGSAEPQPR
jgi:hydroxymethylpyrimidine pyrophosphatase-like HAD family hydrolase/energy-coupling factor transporter ATP-binding protein EcfA2